MQQLHIFKSKIREKIFGKYGLLAAVDGAVANIGYIAMKRFFGYIAMKRFFGKYNISSRTLARWHILDILQ